MNKATQSIKSSTLTQKNGMLKTSKFKNRIFLFGIILLAVVSAMLILWLSKRDTKRAVTDVSNPSITNAGSSIKVGVQGPSTPATSNPQMDNAKNIQIISAINEKRSANNRPVLEYKDELQSIATSMANAVTGLQSNSPTTKLTIEMLDDFYAKAGGNRETSIYTTLIGIGCQTDAATIADQMYGHQDSFLRNPQYTKMAIGISTLDWGCSIIAVLSE